MTRGTRCPNCGVKGETGRFCTSCGAELVAGDPSAPSRGRGRSLGWLIAVATVLVCAGAGGGVWWWNSTAASRSCPISTGEMSRILRWQDATLSKPTERTCDYRDPAGKTGVTYDTGSVGWWAAGDGADWREQRQRLELSDQTGSTRYRCVDRPAWGQDAALCLFEFDWDAIGVMDGLTGLSQIGAEALFPMSGSSVSVELRVQAPRSASASPLQGWDVQGPDSPLMSEIDDVVAAVQASDNWPST